MYKGRNKAKVVDNYLRSLDSKEMKAVEKRPCVFLSHKKEDKSACRQIAEYLSNAQVDYYLDEKDDVLQRAVSEGNAHLITESLKVAIKESTHMMVVVSELTSKSQWVPFEVGYGDAVLIDKPLKEATANDILRLAILILKGLARKQLPDFMHTSYRIEGIKSLNEYIKQLFEIQSKSLDGNLLPAYYKQIHPLGDVLEWNL